MIEARNAAARTDASKYNNQLAGQNYEDQLRKIQGKTGLTESTNRTVGLSGQARANNTLGQASLLGDAAGSFGKLSGSDDGKGKKPGGSVTGEGANGYGGSDVDLGDGGEDESVESGDD